VRGERSSKREEKVGKRAEREERGEREPPHHLSDPKFLYTLHPPSLLYSIQRHNTDIENLQLYT
jgi:hypothetical protein